MKVYKFDYIQDPSHGWVKVPIALLKRFGIETRITPFSYRRKAYAYLEEDCDLMTLVNELEARSIPFMYENKVAYRKHSKIRSYEHYYIGD
jgi:hypothetical protein